MLTLTPGCACDVCAEEYGPHRLPHSIPCGHVLCANCCTTIVEKTNPRLSPVCPFCREPFAGDAMRVIRMDFATSGWTTPRRVPALEGLTDINSTLLQRKTANLFSGAGATRSRIEVRRLEDKVSRIAAKKCSVEEVNALYKELEEWLLAEKDEQTNSLFLSAALLRAILMNHVAHSEASKAAKTSDANLRNKISDLEQNNTRLDAELRRQRANCKQLQTEVNQLRALASTVSSDPSSTQSSTPFPYSSSHTTSTTSPATSPTPYSAAQAHYPSSSASASANPTPLARFNMLHARSASMSSRPATPASIALAHSSHPISPPRSHTPAAPPRSHTPGPTSSASASASASASSPMRSHTPAPRSHTPGPSSSASASSASPMRSHTPAPRSHTPGPGISPARSHTPAPGLSSASAAAAAHAAHARAHTPASFNRAGGGGVPPMPSMPTRYGGTPAGGLGLGQGPPVSPSAGMGFASSGMSAGLGLGLGLSSGMGSGMGMGSGLSSSMGMGSGGAGNTSLFRSQTPAPPALVPPKPRRLSLSGSPPRALARSASEEKAEAFVRWLPPSLSLNVGAGGGEYEYGKHARSASRAGR